MGNIFVKSRTLENTFDYTCPVSRQHRDAMRSKAANLASCAIRLPNHPLESNSYSTENSEEPMIAFCSLILSCGKVLFT
jgi:hypothetical protein